MHSAEKAEPITKSGGYQADPPQCRRSLEIEASKGGVDRLMTYLIKCPLKACYIWAALCLLKGFENRPTIAGSSEVACSAVRGKFGYVKAIIQARREGSGF